MDEEPGIPLALAIKDLRSELSAAMAEGESKSLRFKLQPVELELQLGITNTGEGGGGVKFWVLDFSGKVTAERTATHRLKVVLEPVNVHGEQILVGDVLQDGEPK